MSPPQAIVLLPHGSLPSLGFRYSTNQLFWLAAAPALSGATLRIFYSFMVPLVGGRRWTAISTASLLIPAIGIGFAVRDNTTSYPTMLLLALLCGLGGGNFSSSMANISFFVPKERKGSALGVNAGLGDTARRCKLYDFQRRCWTGFDGRPTSECTNRR